MDFGIADRVALVTGASVGIGSGVAKALAAEGARLAIVARGRERLEALATEVEGEGYASPLVIAADIAGAEGVKLVLETVAQRLGGVDILVNNAGTSMPLAPGDEAEVEQIWQASFDLNFTAGRRLIDGVLPHMRQKKWGRIVNITGYMEPRHLNAAYSAKAALNVWSKGISGDVASQGVTVNCIAPGVIRSEQILERLMPDAELRKQFIAANIPAGDMGYPEDIGHVVAFLASQQASYLTGALIPVDGGMHYFAG